ncbi:TorD/DmsD family molecular chaperone [Neobacillus massiliamazoniensis]|uniref:TorD/DmsD family molecular chaperone n=1 Tax=Neobacillus massiliamazoniensis TaxID=1499688 RepID=UPI00159EE2F2|nr:molecular chaperone TorD family protein [Neobacillus massiliamazoniensis]
MTASKELLHQQYHSFLLSRKKFYHVLHLLFLEPNSDILFQIRDSCNPHELQEIHEGGKILSGFFKDLSKEQISKEQEEYQRLFVGPGPLGAPLWESYYRSKEKLLFEKWTYQIREYYHRFGLQSMKENNEPDDHLLLELEFMVYLSDLFLEENSNEKMIELITTQITFIENHLLKWIPSFCNRIIQNTNSQLFLGAAMLLYDFLEFDLQSLRELKGELAHA